MRHIIPISGKDSLAAAIIQRNQKPEIDYEFMVNQTGEELPEVFEWIKKVELFLGKSIIITGESLRDIIEHDYNWFLPSRNARYCTRLSKIEPMEKFIGKEPATVYYGIRFDEQQRSGYNNAQKKNIIIKCPLIDAEMSIDDVYALNASYNLSPPTFFWQWMWDYVTERTGVGVFDSYPKWKIDALFSWRTRTNCAMCFNQRRYEWIGLLEHHPNMFWEYESWEHNVSEYFLAGKNMPLKKMADQASVIKIRRANAIIKYVVSGMTQPLFDEPGFVDTLSATSCGLLCGK